MNLWEKYYNCFTEHADANAFYIGGRFYTYGEFIQYISGSQQKLLKHTNRSIGIPVGVMCHDTIETFAAIFAVWFSGCHFVPLHPLHPIPVNTEKITQSGLNCIIDSGATPPDYAGSLEIICNDGLNKQGRDHDFRSTSSGLHTFYLRQYRQAERSSYQHREHECFH